MAGRATWEIALDARRETQARRPAARAELPAVPPGGLSQRETAKALGMSRSWVRVIEVRAIAKIAKALGLRLRWPRWARRLSGAVVRGRYACGHCGERGHNARSCRQAGRR